MSFKTLLDSLKPAAPKFHEPMKARLAHFHQGRREWAFEIKFDGVRALAIRDGGRIELISRNRKDLAQKYPQLMDGLRKLKPKQFVLDGEVVALDGEGRSSFQLLQRANQPGGGDPPLFFYAFDLLNLDGRDLMPVLLRGRKAVLREVVKGRSDCIRLSDFLPGSIEEITRQLRGYGLEGIISKDLDSKYESGARSGAWIKIKWAAEQEFVIGGYTDPEGSRKYFGAVLVGYYEEGRLLYASKVGTGFDDQRLRSLFSEFQKRSRKDCPFANLPEPGTTGRQGLTASKMRSCHWIEPEMVCQVRFTEWTSDGHLRQPVFLGLREDRDPREVLREPNPEAQPLTAG